MSMINKKQSEATKLKISIMICKSYKGNDFTCLECGYRWKSREKGFYPYNCPACKSNSWDFERNIKCFCCRKTPIILAVHHLDGNHKHNTKENRIVLCYQCHSFIHLGCNLKRRSGTSRGFRDYRYTSPEILFKLNQLRKKMNKYIIQTK